MKIQDRKAENKREKKKAKAQPHPIPSWRSTFSIIITFVVILAGIALSTHDPYNGCSTMERERRPNTATYPMACAESYLNTCAYPPFAAGNTHASDSADDSVTARSYKATTNLSETTNQYSAVNTTVQTDCRTGSYHTTEGLNVGVGRWGAAGQHSNVPTAMYTTGVIELSQASPGVSTGDT